MILDCVDVFLRCIYLRHLLVFVVVAIFGRAILESVPKGQIFIMLRKSSFSRLLLIEPSSGYIRRSFLGGFEWYDQKKKKCIDLKKENIKIIARLSKREC